MSYRESIMKVMASPINQNPTEAEYKDAAFKLLGEFVREKRSFPSSGIILAEARHVAFLLYARIFRVLDNDGNLVKNTADSIAAYYADTKDKWEASKARSRRADRDERNREIVDCHLTTGKSIRELVEHLNTTQRKVTHALDRAGIHPLRDKMIAETLSFASAELVRVLERAAPGNRMSLFVASQTISLLSITFQSFSLENAIEEINGAPLNLRLALDDTQYYLIYSKGSKRNYDDLLRFCWRVISSENNLLVHKLTLLNDQFREPEFRTTFGSVIYSLLHLDEGQRLDIIEPLWLNSFNFRDKERVRMILRRAYAGWPAKQILGEFERIIKYVRFEDEKLMLKHAFHVTNRCLSQNYETRIYDWLESSDIKSKMSEDELQILDNIYAAARLYNDFDDLFDSIFMLLYDIGDKKRRVDSNKAAKNEKQIDRTDPLKQVVLQTGGVIGATYENRKVTALDVSDEYSKLLDEEDCKLEICDALESDRDEEAREHEEAVRAQHERDLGEELGPPGSY
jgi:hypothetical protein